MKIVLVHNSYQEPGGEDIVFESEKRLLERAGHRVITYVRSNAELQGISALGRIAFIPRMVWSPKSRRDFSAVLDAEDPAIVHVHNTFMVISPSIYSACSQRKIPVIQTLHNFRLLCPSSNLFRDGRVCEECLDHGLLRSVRHGCYRNSRGATAGVALMLASHRKLKTWRHSVSRFVALTEFAKEKFMVKPNFVDPDPSERTSIGEYAVYLGRLADDKGLRVLLNAWKHIPRNYRLQIIGDGSERAALEVTARELQLPEITFRGRLSHEDAIATVKHARFMVVPSMWYEGFPMTIAESFACGTPVLCSRLGGMKEIVTDQRTGLHFEPGDAVDLARKVHWAWEHPQELAAMGREARRQYERSYTPEKNYTILLNIYEQALERPLHFHAPVAVLD
jgi:glycosyltransferase involved in cell wall biosynthesis